MNISNLSFIELVKLKYEVEKKIINEYVEEIKIGNSDNKLLRAEIFDGAKYIDDNEAFILSYTSTEIDLRWKKDEISFCSMCEQIKKSGYRSILISKILICDQCYSSEKLQGFEIKIFDKLEELKKAEKIVKL
jgi:hypothetical protein